MADISVYTEFIRTRITELRLEKGVAESKMSGAIGRSPSYIRTITNGGSLPSVRELFKIIEYFGMGPVEFFAPLADEQSQVAKICERLRHVDKADLQKIDTFITWITEDERPK